MYKKSSMLTSLLMLLICFSVQAQHPGGVSGHTLWLYNTAAVKKTTTKSMFNFNPVLDKEKLKLSYPNIINSAYTFFAVFRSDNSEERELFKIIKGRHKVVIFNKRMASSEDVEFKKMDSKTGSILSMSVNTNQSGKKNNQLAINEVFSQDDAKHQLLELIYYPKILSKVEKLKIETYLAIKYGISLNYGADYISSDRDTLWKHSENKNFSHRITGILADNKSGLEQKQSANSQSALLTVGLHKIATDNGSNNTPVKDQTSFLWGDNNDAVDFVKTSSDNITVFKRIWHIEKRNFHKSDTIQVAINKKEAKLSNAPVNSYYYIIAASTPDFYNNPYASDFFKITDEDEENIYFNSVSLNENVRFLTLATVPDIAINSEATCGCNNNSGKITSKVIGGSAPYQYEIVSRGKLLNSETSDKEEITFNDLTPGDYQIKITDSQNKTQIKNIHISAPGLSAVSLKKEWKLSADHTVIVTPTITSDKNDITLEWMKGNEMLGSDYQQTFNTTGDYLLRVSSKNGCSTIFSFSVLEADSGVSLFPNPVKKGDAFNVKFDLTNPEDVSIKIHSLEGKIHYNNKLGLIRNYNFQYDLQYPGLYLITITRNGIEETTKLIVTD